MARLKGASSCRAILIIAGMILAVGLFPASAFAADDPDGAPGNTVLSVVDDIVWYSTLSLEPADGHTVSCLGNAATLLDYEAVLAGGHPDVGANGASATTVKGASPAAGDQLVGVVATLAIEAA